MSAQPAMGIGGVEEVELAPDQVPHGGGDGLHGTRLRGMDEGDNGGPGEGASEDHDGRRWWW